MGYTHGLGCCCPTCVNFDDDCLPSFPTQVDVTLPTGWLAGSDNPGTWPCDCSLLEGATYTLSVGKGVANCPGTFACTRSWFYRDDVWCDGSSDPLLAIRLGVCCDGAPKICTASLVVTVGRFGSTVNSWGWQLTGSMDLDDGITLPFKPSMCLLLGVTQGEICDNASPGDAFALSH